VGKKPSQKGPVKVLLTGTESTIMSVRLATPEDGEIYQPVE
jgi:hypothetical protein